MRRLQRTGTVFRALGLANLRKSRNCATTRPKASYRGRGSGMTVLDAHTREDLEATGVGAMLAALEAKDSYSGRHCSAVLELATAVGSHLGLPDESLRELGHVALLHDVGKIGVPDSILRKPGRLDSGERELMERHPVIGERMLGRVPALAHLAPAVRAEHERFDGGGYPDGIAGEAIPITSRVTFVCDAYHAMCSNRPYRPALPESTALAELKKHRGSQFCPIATDALLGVLPDVFSTLDGHWRWRPGSAVREAQAA
jgi:HD-GYP domain-containing protein (c-di-GMP phosphodiesterase class II)